MKEHPQENGVKGCASVGEGFEGENENYKSDLRGTRLIGACT